jgi:hypothetical protein
MTDITIHGGTALRNYLTKIAHQFNQVKGKTLRVGFLPSAPHYQRTGLPTAYIASVQEWGDPSHNIPARPFFRTCIKENQKSWSKTAADYLKANNNDVEETFRDMGATITGQLINSIVNGQWVPNAPATVRRKGFQKPLIESGQLVNAISYEIV